MRVLRLLLTICIFFSANIYSQAEDGEKKVKMYCVSWNTTYKLAHTIENIKKKYIYYFETDVTWLNTMFLNYEDCVEKLSKQKVVSSLSDEGNIVRTNVLIELHFSKKKIIKLFFNNDGDFYFDKRWHKRNDGFYYLLFKYFSNELIPQTILEESKKNYKDKLWHPIIE